MMWKDFFYFTKTERQGILVLVVLIIVFFSLPYVFLLQNQAEETDASEQELAEKEFQAFIASLKTDSTRLYSSESKREIYKKRESGWLLSTRTQPTLPLFFHWVCPHGWPATFYATGADKDSSGSPKISRKYMD